jgi:hypothetical protein
MKISERTISVLARIITGDTQIARYRTGPELVKFFNYLGYNDVYGSGFPTRWYFCEEKLRELNNTPKLSKVFELVLDPREYLDTTFSIKVVVDNLNEYLKYDGYELVAYGKFYKVKEISGITIELESLFQEHSEVSQIFLDEQIKKCDKKIMDGDYSGAITNARSLLESVLLEVEKKLNPQSESYDGDLPKLFRRVQGLLNYDPSRKDISDAIKQVLGGLSSVVNGVATLRNKASDAHGTNYIPTKEMAKLVVNASKTVVDYIFCVFSSIKESTD